MHEDNDFYLSSPVPQPTRVIATRPECKLCFLYLNGFCGVFYTYTEHRTIADAFNCNHAMVLWSLIKGGEDYATWM